jgi:Tol biopolymer transport system component
MNATAGRLVLVVALAVAGCTGSPTASDSDPSTQTASFDPAVHRIAFVSNRDDGIRRIYVAGADGGSVTRLTEGEAPAWSRDGRRIAYHRAKTGQTGDSFEMHVIDADGTQRRLAAGRDPDWSPDDRQLVFVGNDGIYVINADGSTLPRRLLGNEQPLPRDPLYDPSPHPNGYVNAPTWSPDGRRIAFERVDVSLELETTNTIYLMNADGSDPRPLVVGCPIEPPGRGAILCPTYSPAWSPDGTRVVVATYAHDGATGQFNRVLASLTTSGTTRRTVVSLDVVPADPDWSPDGRQVVFTRIRQQAATQARIFTVDLESGQARQLIPDAGSSPFANYGDGQPVWSRAGG